MERQNAERKLAAILAADVAGYSRLMGADEEGTLAQLKAHRRALVVPKIKEHRGKIINTTGDGTLVEFGSVVDAVRCAVEIQRGMAERNAGVPQNKRIEFRVGINLGDIIHDEKDIFGDGVNVAARLEGLAEPGGICISRSVRDPVRDKLGLTFEDIGEQAMKNIAAPIHAYRVRFESAEPAARVTALIWPARKRNVAGAWVIGLAAATAAIVMAGGVWSAQLRPLQPRVHALAAVQTAPLSLPDKPSIAVLPFTNIGGDAKQERLADGLTEDVITDLSRYRDLFVIARNSVMTYKDKPTSVQQVGRNLGVRYVLEGSIQTSGDRVRVTAQLIDATTDSHVWSQRYDRALDDIFDVQNDVTQKISAALGRTTGAVAVAETASARRKSPSNLQAYDYYLLGMECHYRSTKESESKAEEFFKRAIELDPQLARAYTGLALVYNDQAQFGWAQDIMPLMEKAKSLALQAIVLDSTSGWAYAVLGLVYSELSDYDHALAAFEQAFILNPNDSDILMFYGNMALPFVGRANEGVELVNRAFRLNPHHPNWYNLMADPFYATGHYNQAISMLRRFTGDLPPWSIWLLATSYAQLRQKKEAAAAMAELSRRFPDASFERMLSEFGAIRDEATLAHYLKGARKAGLRDCASEAEVLKYPKMTHLAFCDTKRATD